MTTRMRVGFTWLQRAWSSVYTKYYLLAVLVAVTLANLLDVRIVGWGPLDAAATAAIGTWFAGMLTVITIAIAAQALRHDRINAEEEARSAMASSLERQRLADGAVFAWLRLRRDEVMGTPMQFTLQLNNQTGVPVYRWELVVEGYPVLTCTEQAYGPILPGSTDIELPGEEWLRVAREGRTARVSLRFVAASGELMLRKEDGRLECPVAPVKHDV